MAFVLLYIIFAIYLKKNFIFPCNFAKVLIRIVIIFYPILCSGVINYGYKRIS